MARLEGADPVTEPNHAARIELSNEWHARLLSGPVAPFVLAGVGWTVRVVRRRLRLGARDDGEET